MKDTSNLSPRPRPQPRAVTDKMSSFTPARPPAQSHKRHKFIFQPPSRPQLPAMKDGIYWGMGGPCIPFVYSGQQNGTCKSWKRQDPQMMCCCNELKSLLSEKGVKLNWLRH